MGVHGSDVDHWLERVPSCLYFTEPIGSHAYGSSICWILDEESERKSLKKFRTPEKFQTAESYRRERSSDEFRWYRRVVSGYTIKSIWFWQMPDNSWRVPESFWKLFGIFWDKNRKCSGAVGATSDAFRRWKSLKSELFRNALKIIMVGTGNVLSPHKYFQFEWTLKNVVVNSESAFWDIYVEPPFWTWSMF